MIAVGLGWRVWRWERSALLVVVKFEILQGSLNLQVESSSDLANRR